ncbi:MAG: biotin carboxylase N-terminal domain-containing protein [Bacillota bacterium]|nr:biotin carboxylase N-terminal domain-containing protein [Bacillota bacterium]
MRAEAAVPGPAPRPFRRVLVANRGEIARRVIRACHRLGLEAVAVYSDADAGGLWVREADAAIRLGPAPARESYLDVERLLAAARETGAEAVHPGYGFLAEEAGFAEAVERAGLVWIGPPPEAMRAMGDKSRARQLARRLGVPVLEGYDGEEQEARRFLAEAERIGWPVLVKAAAGGGGRGMRVVPGPEELPAALESARREAEAAFGDGRLLLERYVERPRHVEVQLLFDAFGRGVHLGERECSVQRRHQKIVEESPSPAVDPALRSRLGEAALELARAVGYRSAGTVEFLLDQRGRFHFLEMNTRIQVEHPVTEEVTGLDLVALQLRLAMGEPLPFDQEAVALRGHAFEVRLYAESPEEGFLPSSGRLERFGLPEPAGRGDARGGSGLSELPGVGLPGLRVEAGFAAGDEVSPYYDALLAKLVTHGADREEALERLQAALAATEVRGVATNLPLLRRIAADPAFAAGDLSTRFLEERRLLGAAAAPPEAAVAAAVAEQLDRSGAARGGADRSPFTLLGPWRMGEGIRSRWSQAEAGQGHPARAAEAAAGGGEAAPALVVRLRGEGHRLRARVTREPAGVPAGEAASEGAAGTYRLLAGRPVLGGWQLQLEAEGGREAAAHGPRRRLWARPLAGGGWWVAEAGEGSWELRQAPPAPPAGRRPPVAASGPEEKGAASAVAVVSAPLPGTLAAVRVRPGERVERNQPLVVLEAMKMEHLVTAPQAGRVEELLHGPGDVVQRGEPLLRLVP